MKYSRSFVHVEPRRDEAMHWVVITDMSGYNVYFFTFQIIGLVTWFTFHFFCLLFGGLYM